MMMSAHKAPRMLSSVALALVVAISLSSCTEAYEGLVATEERTIRVDVQNLVFEPYVATAAFVDRGIGASTVTVTVTTDLQTVAGSLSAADPAYNYTQVPIVVAGTLQSVSASIATSGGQSFTATLGEWEDGSAYTKWTIFANVRKFRLTVKTDAVAVADSTLALEPSPRGGAGLRLLWDSGVTDADFAKTDRGELTTGSLNAGQIAIMPQWLENPAGLTYTVYAAVVSENLQAKYDPVFSNEDNPDPDNKYCAEYISDPWTGSWTVAEMDSTGKSIGGIPVKLEIVTPPDRVATKPMLADSLTSCFLDYSAQVGKYLIVGIVVMDETGISVPSQVVCIPIR